MAWAAKKSNSNQSNVSDVGSTKTGSVQIFNTVNRVSKKVKAELWCLSFVLVLEIISEKILAGETNNQIKKKNMERLLTKGFHVAVIQTIYRPFNN